MSGLAGVWNLDGQPADRITLARMAAAIAHRGSDDSMMCCSGTAGFASQLSRVTPESTEDTLERAGLNATNDGHARGGNVNRAAPDPVEGVASRSIPGRQKESSSGCAVFTVKTGKP